MSGQDFAGRVALVTGGASGIGRAVVRGFHDRGAHVVIADLDETKGPAYAAELGEGALYVRLNVADEADWTAATAAATARFGGLDFVLNAAGISHTASVAALEMEDWQTIVGVNQTGTFLGCKHGIQAIAATGRGGAIVNVSSVQGVHAHAASFAYNTTKAAVRMMSKSAALSGALFDPPIRCNTVIPGYVSTPMLEPVSLLFGGREAMEEAMTRDVPLGRMCSAEDIAEAVLFFMSDKAAMITGAELVVDGGLILPMNMSYLK
ncbi:SDR family oxidoreductase [Zavarzinia compransoris]|uniref:SDR family NAD(P)-dependent oxidoreductase n=1 Tax=Zavarzinia marina TaxID=2911065 RepID=UPI001F3B9994|nr:SDR family oxidoreductase [Zavarzinia marina]MCF4165161.1 SDR family oxidoreductase [Zavarzinia marina]